MEKKLINFTYLSLLSIFFIFSIVSSSIRVFAIEECFSDLGSNRKDLESALEECQDIINKTEKVLQNKQRERTDTEFEVLLIDKEVNEALLEIRTSDITIGQLGEEIVVKERTVEDLKGDIKEQKLFLSEILQRTSEVEERGFLDLLLSGTSFSNYFQKGQEYDVLRESFEDSISSIDNKTLRLTNSVDELENRKIERARLRQQQQAAAEQIKYQKNEKEKILKAQLAEEDSIKSTIASIEDRAAQIRNRLFDLRGGGAIQFDEALSYAKEVEAKLGVDAAFLLGLIKTESDLGKNVGQGSYLIDMHPTRDRPIFPFIADLFGFEADDLRVSANPGFGWGGAMGPAQFIPSTWVCYGGLINEKTGTCARRSNLIKTSSNLQIGSSGGDVKKLHTFLKERDFYNGEITSSYSSETARAVSKFQEEYSNRILRPYGYTRGTGTVGPSTRAAINELYFGEGPWEYVSSKDVIRKFTKSNEPSNPWDPRDAFFASGIYLEELGAVSNPCTAARRYYAGGNWRSKVALNYCRSVQSNATLFQKDIDYLEA